jgi:hypothetical protein
MFALCSRIGHPKVKICGEFRVESAAQAKDFCRQAIQEKGFPAPCSISGGTRP